MAGTLMTTVCGKMNNKKLAATGFIFNIKVFTKY